METILIAIFIVGYLAIIFEHNLHVNKAAPALAVGILTWSVYALLNVENLALVEEQLHGHLAEIAGILFFLLGAMTIVELIDAHKGFEVITRMITTRNPVVLLWVITFITFFLSSVLDNLTTTIVMVSIIRKLIKARQQKLFFASMIVIAANSGGAWSPIGDVTTTMLWIGGQITTLNIIKMLFIPSLFSTVVPLSLASIMIIRARKRRGATTEEVEETGSGHGQHADVEVLEWEKKLVFFAGILALLFAPIFKTVTHLPPFMGIMLSLSVLWLMTEIMHKNKKDQIKNPLSVIGVLKRVDTPSVLFFFGILLAIASLQSVNILSNLATALDHSVGNIYVIGFALGVMSAVIDNVPLVAASMGMYDLATYPPDHVLWEYIAYCAGTGGSMLIIGSAAGVAAMGMERIDFVWYVKNITWLAFLGYCAGAFIYIVQHVFICNC